MITWSNSSSDGIAAAIDQAVKAARRKPSKRKPKRTEMGDGPAAEAS